MKGFIGDMRHRLKNPKAMMVRLEKMTVLQVFMVLIIVFLL